MNQNDQNVNNSTNDMAQNSINNGGNNTPNNQQPRKMKTSYLVLIGVGVGVFLLIVIFGAIFVFHFFDKTKDAVEDTANKTQDQANEIIDDATDLIDSIIDQGTNDDNQTDTTESEKKAHNAIFELYEGTQSGSAISILLQQIALNNQAKNDQAITVIFDATTTNDSDRITELKQNVDSSKTYEVSFDYDSDGFISKVTIQ